MAINTVIVSESAESLALLKNVLKQSNYEIIFCGFSVPALLADSELGQPDLIVISINKPDALLIQQLKTINEQYPLPIVVFTKSDSDNAIEQFIEAGVSAYIVDGLSQHRVLAILKTATARFQQNLRIHEEITALKSNLADRKIIDRAKGIIMAQRQCSEQEAYTLLRTNAMTQNTRLAALAKNIVDTASLLTAS